MATLPQSQLAIYRKKRTHTHTNADLHKDVAKLQSSLTKADVHKYPVPHAYTHKH